MKLNMKLPQAAELILDRLNGLGYSAYVVGGSVRDFLIGRELGDLDITTAALPEETKAAFPEYRTVDTGIKHGTVSLIIDGVPYEVTTYRIDGDYKDNRHPESVEFTDRLADDLCRRDFTVNAMAYSPEDGLVDLYGGRDDIESRLIRAVGDPAVRFDEDALRILRALRFSSVLDFDIEAATANAAREKKSLLDGVSRERIYTELKKLVMGPRASSVLTEYADVLSVALDGLEIHRLPSDDALGGADYFTRLALIFLLNSDDPAMTAERVLTGLKTDKLTRVRVAAVLSAYGSASFENRRAALTTLAKHGRETTEGILALGLVTRRFGDSDRSALADAMESRVPYTISGLAIRGDDLVSMGIKGEQVGKALNDLLFAVIEGKVKNEKSALIDYL